MATKRTGRPPVGRDEGGRPAPASKVYPQLTVRLPPEVKATLDLVATVEGRTQAQVIEAAMNAYVATLPAASQKAIQELMSARLAGSKKRGT